MQIDQAIRDPLGQCLLAYMKGQLSAAVTVHAENGAHDAIPAQYLFRSRSEMPTLEQQALDSCRGKVLDIGAGAGSHALALQQQGLEVHALDISRGAVTVMQQRGVRKAHHGSIWAWQGPPVDTLLLLMNGIGLVGDLDGLDRLLGQASQWLHPGGQIILDSSDLIYLYEEEEDPRLDLINPYYGIVRYQMQFETAISPPFDWLYLDYPRLHRHAAQHGFHCEKLMEGPHYDYLAKLTLQEAGNKDH